MGKVALEKVSETPDGDELFVILFVDGSEIATGADRGCLVSGELTEPAIRQLFRDAHRPHAYVDAMFQIARHLFDEQARRGEAHT
jgi:hypothetical protein